MTLLPACCDPVGGGAAPVVVDADDRRSVRLHAGDQPFLHRRVVRERAVPVDVIFGDVEQDADRWIERRRQIDLVRRHLDHMHAARARRLEREDRGADVAAHLHVVAGFAHQVRDQRGGGRLAVGAGDRHERRVRRSARALAAEQFDVADHRNAGPLRGEHGPVRRRMRQRHAGRQHQRSEVGPRDFAQIGGGEAGLRRLGEALGIVVAGDDVRRRRPSAHDSSQAPTRRGRTPQPSCPRSS